MEEYKRVHERQVIAKVLRTGKWQAPQGNEVEINFDGASNRERTIAGIGVIARHNKGEVLGSLCSTAARIRDPEIIEGLAAVKAAEYARMLGFRRVILEGDALGFITQLAQDQGNNLFAVWNLVTDTRKMLNHMAGWSCSHFDREANGAAHKLERMAVDNLESSTWNGGYPDHIPDIVFHENHF
ncbi:uncharacterized protein LOC111293384 [Durio zibethinus]|uniref:Uncharacterized protein LOC111293384 n=1 Tax=Durio zibethinus TaxID=66656 RepID=A0A6P5YP17_DURZI|nr:uncharacterized protein LOC111293384 [Durio zibethinus]